MGNPGAEDILYQWIDDVRAGKPLTSSTRVPDAPSYRATPSIAFWKHRRDAPRFGAMEAMSGLVLAVGAAGKFAGHIVPALVARSATVRGFVHDAKALASIVKKGPWMPWWAISGTNAASQRRWRGGVGFLRRASLPAQRSTGGPWISSPQRSRRCVRRFVFSSVIHPVLSALSNHAAKAPVEEAILDSGLHDLKGDAGLFHASSRRSGTSMQARAFLSSQTSVV